MINFFYSKIMNTLQKKKPSIKIAIAAYNAEENIKQLLLSLLSQRQLNFSLDNIIVYSDASTDQTVYKAQIHNKKIKVIDSQKRGGFAHAAKFFITTNDSEVLIILNDDIKINDVAFIEKIVEHFTLQENVGLVCGNPQPLKSKSFIDSALSIRLKASEELSCRVNNGNNVFSCDGKILALSKKLCKKITFPNRNKDLGNVDAYLYFACITSGFKYIFVKDAIVRFRNPMTLGDYIKWISRNNIQKSILIKSFGSQIVHKEYLKPRSIFIYTLLKEFLKNPLGGMFIILTELYIFAKSKKEFTNFSETWETVKTTKNLNT